MIIDVINWLDVEQYPPPFAVVVEVRYSDGSTGFDAWVPGGLYAMQWKTGKTVTHWAQDHLTKYEATAPCRVCGNRYVYDNRAVRVCARCGAEQLDTH